MASNYVSTKEAADQLGVSTRQIRNMVAHGRLDVLKSGNNLLVSTDSLNRAYQVPRRAGRAWTPRIAWAALAMLDGADAAWLQPSERYRLRQSLQTRTVDDLMAAARNRATVRRFRATPDAISRLLEHVAATGGTAMRDADIASKFGLAGGGGFLDGYVPVGVAEEMAEAFYMEADTSGNVTLREVEFEEALKAGVPTAAIALDLAESVATREHSAGRSVLEKLLDEQVNRG
jgi:excisionase family DNA binding protein